MPFPDPHLGVFIQLKKQGRQLGADVLHARIHGVQQCQRSGLPELTKPASWAGPVAVKGLGDGEVVAYQSGWW